MGIGILKKTREGHSVGEKRIDTEEAQALCVVSGAPAELCDKSKEKKK